MDEKSQIQALDRSQPTLPLRPGQPARRSHDDKRHGTTSLFAALDIATGAVIGKCYSRHRAREFRDFLDEIERNVPADLDVHAQAIAASYDLPMPDPAEADVSDPALWIIGSFAIAQNGVYTDLIGEGAGPFELTEDYEESALATARERAALAGARLANLPQRGAAVIGNGMPESFRRENAEFEA